MLASMWEEERESVCGHSSIRCCPAGRCSALSSSAVWWCVDGSKYE